MKKVKPVEEVKQLIRDEGPAAVTAMCEALENDVTTTELGLNGDGGAAALAEELKVNCTLTTMNLYGNNIGHEGAAALTEALKVGCTLKS